MSKSSKSKKENKSSYSVSKEKILKTYKESAISSHSNYTNEPKCHKRSSSDSQKLYDLNKWNNFSAQIEKQKWNTNENSSRFRKKTRKTVSKDRHKNNKSSNVEKSAERASSKLKQFYNPKHSSKFDNSDAMLNTPRSLNFIGQNSSKWTKI